VNPDPLQLDDDEPWPLYHEPRRSWLSRLIAAIRRRIA
jgi:hypothetical protein